MSDVDEPIGSRLKGPSPCDTCRLRKVRCDRQSPCSNCKTANIRCVSTDLPPPKRKRVHLSDEYNSDISEIKHGIDKIWSHLNSQNTKLITTTSQSPAEVITRTPLTALSSSNQDQWPPFEGGSSFHAVSQKVLDEIQKDTPLPHQLAVPSLSEPSIPGHLELRRSSGTSQLLLIPSAKMLRILQAAGNDPDVLDEFPFIDLEELSSLCQTAYFPIQGLSVADFITMQSCVFFMTRDLVQQLAEKFDFDPLEIQQILSQCSTTLAQVTQELTLLIQPSFENIRALVLLISVLLETDRFATASSITSIVSRLCLDAGYHRLNSNSTADKIRQKRLLFWKTYVLDRGFALSLGKAPSIPEYEIYLDRPSASEVPGLNGVYFNGWIDFAEIQGQIYEQLYSPRAQRADTAAKASTARGLAERLTSLSTSMPSDQVGLTAEMRWHGEIAINTMLTLVYYAIETDSRHEQSSRNPTPESLRYARIGLDKLNEAWEALGDGEEERQSASFLVWSVQFSPFAPFIVVLRNVSYHHHDNETDMTRLRKAVAAIETTTKISSGIARLHGVCQKLLDLTENRLSSIRQRETDIDEYDGPVFGTENYDFVAVMEDTENMPLFMDSWEAFLNSQN